jgi:hypothetical protein
MGKRINQSKGGNTPAGNGGTTSGSEKIHRNVHTGGWGRAMMMIVVGKWTAKTTPRGIQGNAVICHG